MKSQLSSTRLAEIRQRTLAEVANLPDRIGRYEIRGELGHGGMGIVYDGYDPRLERRVAVKVIHREKLGEGADSAEVAERFEREMQATSDLFHPNVVAILDAGFESGAGGGQAYYVMERVEGDSLEQRLQEVGALVRSEVLEIAASVARGLAAAHGKGVVHRDLKPSNVLLPLSGSPRIADFGLCRLRSELGSVTGADAILGSAHYIAPEQLRGSSGSDSVTGAADLFSLGAVIVRMWTGREPFAADSLAAHFYRILNDDADGLEELDEDVRSLVEQLMAKHPSDRPASAEWVAEALDALASASPRAGGGELVEGVFGAAPASSATAPSLSMATASEADRSDPSQSRHGGGGGSGPSGAPGSGVASSGSGGAAAQGSWLNRLLPLAAVLVVALGIWCAVRSHNELVSLEQRVTTQWKQVEAQLARQHELIPQLVQVTKRYAAYETETLERIVAARASYGAGSDRAAAASQVEAALGDLLVVAERYPNLKADAHYRGLAHELSGTKNRISVERMRYNEAVGELNGRLGQWPWSWFKGSLEARSYFNPSPEQMADPKLEL